MKIRLVIFDLDGTLLNTIGDLAASCDHVLEQHGLPRHTYEEYCRFVGNGVTRLIERAIPESMRTPETIAALRADFVAYYVKHIDRYTKPYEGIPELLAALAARGVKLAVATNKFQAGTEKLVREFFSDIPFEAVMGQVPDRPLKPDPQVIHQIESQVGVSADEVLYVGDSGVDMDTARAAGVFSVGATWGFRSVEELKEHGADCLAIHPGEILDRLECGAQQ